MNKFYEKYWEDKEGHLGDFKIKWPKLKKFIPLKGNIVIVDFGCGKGEIIQVMEKINPEADYIGLDISKKALDEARRNFSSEEFRQIEDGEKFPLNNDSVDFLFTSEVIEHIYDTENAASEIFRVLKPGGKILLTTPYHCFIKNILIVLFNFNKHFDPTGPHVRFFTKKALFNLLKKQGFEIDKYGFYGRFWPLSHSIYVIAQKPES